jgi:hypothetical protein
MTCNNCYNPSCDSTCGCPQQVKGSCVFYQGANLTCLDVTKGDDYDSILASLNTLICDLVAPTGIQTTLTGCSSITVTQTSSTNYNVCLSTATQTQINNNTSNIATLSACVNSGVLDLVSNDGSVNISVDTPSTGCGVILDLSVPVPSGTPIVDGIIYSDSTKVEANTGVGTDVVLKDSSTSIGSYYLSNGLEVGDEIRWRANGQIDSDGNTVDILKYDFRNGASSGGIINGATFTGFSTGGNETSWQMEGTATVLDNTALNAELLVSVKLFRNGLANSNVSDTVKDLYIFNQTITGVDLTQLRIAIKYNRAIPNIFGPTNFARQLVVEIRKMI